MKAINIQRRRLMTSLALSALAAAPGASWAQTAAKALAPARGARIVVVGAGVGGATAAKYLKLFNKNLDVTLIDRNPNFIRHYGSSELITGAVTMEDLTVSYDALSDRYGVRVVRDTIVGLDADRRTVMPTASSSSRPASSCFTKASRATAPSSPRRRSRAAGSRARRRSSSPTSSRPCPRAAPSASSHRLIRTAARPAPTSAPRS